MVCASQSHFQISLRGGSSNARFCPHTRTSGAAAAICDLDCSRPYSSVDVVCGHLVKVPSSMSRRSLRKCCWKKHLQKVLCKVGPSNLGVGPIPGRLPDLKCRVLRKRLSFYIALVVKRWRLAPDICWGRLSLEIVALRVIAAHRDTHFSFLKGVRVGDLIVVQRSDGQEFRFKVTGMEIVRWDKANLDVHSSKHLLALVTCWPFDARQRGPLRYLILAKSINE